MNYKDLERHCQTVRHFAQSNGIEVKGSRSMMTVIVSQEEAKAVMQDPEFKQIAPFVDNLDPTRKFEILGVTVVPTSVDPGSYRYSLKYGSFHIVLKDITLQSQNPLGNIGKYLTKIK